MSLRIKVANGSEVAIRRGPVRGLEAYLTLKGPDGDMIEVVLGPMEADAIANGLRIVMKK
jgi:hypothetical protein